MPELIALPPLPVADRPETPTRGFWSRRSAGTQLLCSCNTCEQGHWFHVKHAPAPIGARGQEQGKPTTTKRTVCTGTHGDWLGSSARKRQRRKPNGVHAGRRGCQHVMGPAVRAMHPRVVLGVLARPGPFEDRHWLYSSPGQFEMGMHGSSVDLRNASDDESGDLIGKTGVARIPELADQSLWLDGTRRCLAVTK